MNTDDIRKTRAYKKCVVVMKNLCSNGYEEAHQDMILRMIRMYVGYDPRTVKGMMELLQLYGFIERKNEFIFKLNYSQLGMTHDNPK